MKSILFYLCLFFAQIGYGQPILGGAIIVNDTLPINKSWFKKIEKDTTPEIWSRSIFYGAQPAFRYDTIPCLIVYADTSDIEVKDEIYISGNVSNIFLGTLPQKKVHSLMWMAGYVIQPVWPEYFMGLSPTPAWGYFDADKKPLPSKYIVVNYIPLNR